MRSLVRFLRACASPIAIAAAFALTTAGVAAAAPFTRIQVLLPGETAAPGTALGKTGSPTAQTTGVPFTVTVRACDSTWTTVTTVSHTMQILSSDASATLPVPAQLQSGVGTFNVTFNANGSFVVFAHDQSDGTIPDGASATVQSLVLQGFVFNTISQKHFTAGTPETMTIRAVDPQGNTVSGFTGVVRFKETTSFGDGRAVPDSVTLTNGTWTGGVAAWRADETNINRGNCNFYAWLSSAPAKNGTSDPFVVHPAGPARVQLVVPGETALPGSESGKSGTPSSQGAGQSFPVTVRATDAFWNSVPSTDNVTINSSDLAANTPQSGALVGGTRQFNITLNTVGTQTLAVTSSNASLQGMTSPGIQVQPNAVARFVILPIASPQEAGVAVSVTINATDASGNTVPDYSGEVNLSANTGAGSLSPERVTLSGGTWTGPLTFKGAGNAVVLTCSDFAAPPHIGASNAFVVNPGPLAGVLVLLPGETAASGDPDGRSGTPAVQSAGNPFTLTVRAVDAHWNRVPGIAHRVAFASTDSFAIMPAETTLFDGERLVPVRLHKSGPQTITVTDLDAAINQDTSSPVTIIGGPFARVLVLAPGESVAPGTASGRTGDATAQSSGYAFSVTVLATDSWWNPVTGVNDVVHLTCTDPAATVPADTPLSNGRADLDVTLRQGGFSQITVSDVTNLAITGSTTQVEAISSGFHLEASIDRATARAGEYFTVTVRAMNAAGAVIREINSLVTLTALHASSLAPGRGSLSTSQLQLVQGQSSLSVYYTFVEPIVVEANDDAGNSTGASNSIDITPGQPAAIRLSSSPQWVGGNKHALVSARLVDAFENGVPDAGMGFSVISGTGTLTPIDAATDAAGIARADFLSPRQPEVDQIRATSGGFSADLQIETAFVDPTAGGGHITNYPNPFHPPGQGTTLAWKLTDQATVTLRIFTRSGDLVLQRTFDRGAPGGLQGLNTWVWDGRNGAGRLVSSGGYLVLVEAQGSGETMHVMKRRVAVVL